MTKPRFTKGQKIYKIEVHNSRPINITEETVISCGVKRVRLESEYIQNQYTPNQKEGHVDNLISIFHGTKEEAEKEYNLRK